MLIQFHRQMHKDSLLTSAPKTKRSAAKSHALPPSFVRVAQALAVVSPASLVTLENIARDILRQLTL